MYSEARDDLDADRDLEAILAWFRGLRLDRHLLLNTLVYFIASRQFGVAIWKCIVVALVVMLATRWNYGRSTLTRGGVVLLMLTLGIWSELLPPPQQWASAIRHLLTSIV